MIKTMFALAGLAAVAVAVPAAAQMAAGSLPKCSATVRDSCDQSMTTEKNAMSAEQAMKTGGVGDRKSDGAAGAMPMGDKPMMMHKHKMMHHKTMMKHTMKSTTETAPADAAKPM